MQEIQVATKLSGMTCTGEPFDELIVEAVWNKANVIPGYNPDYIRKDICGAAMLRSAYGTTTDYGWEIDHIRPATKDGTDDLHNLQPLHWKNNRHKGDDWPHWSCAVSSR